MYDTVSREGSAVISDAVEATDLLKLGLHNISKPVVLHSQMDAQTYNYDGRRVLDTCYNLVASVL